jgi:hypothetical protein
MYNRGNFGKAGMIREGDRTPFRPREDIEQWTNPLIMGCWKSSR